MPHFAKCYNEECYCYGQFQLVVTGSCTDCGAPLHVQAPPPPILDPGPLSRLQEALAQAFVQAAARGDTEVAKLAILDPRVWERIQQLEPYSGTRRVQQ